MDKYKEPHCNGGNNHHLVHFGFNLSLQSYLNTKRCIEILLSNNPENKEIQYMSRLINIVKKEKLTLANDIDNKYNKNVRNIYEELYKCKENIIEIFKANEHLKNV